MKQLMIFVTLFILASFTPNDCACTASYIPSVAGQEPVVYGYTQSDDVECPCQRGLFNWDCGKEVEDDCFDIWNPSTEPQEGRGQFLQFDGQCDEGDACAEMQEYPCTFVMEIRVVLDNCCSPLAENPEECDWGPCCNDHLLTVGHYCGTTAPTNTTNPTTFFGQVNYGYDNPPCGITYAQGISFSTPDTVYTETGSHTRFFPAAGEIGASEFVMTRIVQIPCNTPSHYAGIAIECKRETNVMDTIVEMDFYYYWAVELKCENCGGDN